MALINDFLSLIYPRHCEACSNNLFRHEAWLCNYCKINLPRSNYHNHEENELCLALAGRIPVLNALSFYLFEKSGKVQKLLHAIKYEGQKELAEYLGKMYAEDLIKYGKAGDIDVIVPIPLHKKKLEQRGFNQSEYFARGLAKALNKHLDSFSLTRKIETKTQTRRKKFERWENVEGIFELQDKEVFRNRHVLIVDDVITTGATLEAAWQCLKDVEGIKISVASIAFAKKGA